MIAAQSDWTSLAHPDEMIAKEDLFYYVYGLLHSPDYREPI